MQEYISFRRMTRLYRLIIFFFFLLCINSCKQPSKQSLPPTMLWVWEARQDLRLLNPLKVGVAVYSGTVTLNESGIIITPSRQLMVFPTHIYRMAVVHLRISPHNHLIFDEKTILHTADAIIQLFQHSGGSALQLDFSATKSQQDFYAEVIRAIHSKLKPETMLSITALANWCVGDRWLSKKHLPIDLVVPMYFSLSQNDREKNDFIDHFPQNINSLLPICQHAVGLATFEDWQPPLHGKVPVFVFTRGSFTPISIKQAFILSNDVREN